MAVHLLFNIEETVAVILFGVGFTMLLLHKNLIKKIMGMNIMDTAVYLFLAAKGYIQGRAVPIEMNGIREVSAYINPVPSGLVLTGIVVSVSTTALMLALTIRLYERYGSLDLDEILTQAKEVPLPAVSRSTKRFLPYRQKQHQNSRSRLRNQSRPGGTTDSPVQVHDEIQVKGNIEYCREHDSSKRSLTVSRRPQKCTGHIIDQPNRNRD